MEDSPTKLTTTTIKIPSIAIIGLVVLCSLATAQMSTERNDPKTDSAIDASGNLRVPSHYRTSYQFLGSWAVADGPNKSPKEMHIVYASPGTIAGYRKNKHFSDGSVLVKEVYQATTGEMETGVVSRAQALKGWFVMVRDSKNTHPGNPLWGEGWVWAWFNADNPSKTTSTSFQTNCKMCHVPVKDTEWVYVQGYPPLESAH